MSTFFHGKKHVLDPVRREVVGGARFYNLGLTSGKDCAKDLDMSNPTNVQMLADEDLEELWREIIAGLAHQDKINMTQEDCDAIRLGILDGFMQGSYRDV